MAFVCFLALAGASHAASKISAEELLGKVVVAFGGKHFKSMTSLSSKGSMIIVGADLQGTCSIYTKAPGMSRMTVRVTDMMDSTEACDGTVAWDYNPFFAVVRQKDEKEAAYMLLHSRTDLLTNYKAHFKKWSIIKESLIDGRKCHVLKLTPKNGVQPFFYHIDAETFLVRREESVFDGPQGRFSITSDIDKYETVKGVSVPKELSIRMSQMTIKVVFKSVAINVPLPDALFKNPSDMTVAIHQKNALEYEVGKDNPITMTRKQLLDALREINSIKDDFKIKTIVLTGAKDVRPQAVLASSYWLRNLAKTVNMPEAATPVGDELPATKNDNGNGDDK
jgi:outer membrane lipoprotein-sorting protein